MPGQVPVLDGMGHANILWGITVIIDGHLTSKTVINPPKEITAYSTCRLGFCPVSTFNGWDHRHHRTRSQLIDYCQISTIIIHFRLGHFLVSGPRIITCHPQEALKYVQYVQYCHQFLSGFVHIMLCQLFLSFSGNGMFCRHASSLN